MSVLTSGMLHSRSPGVDISNVVKKINTAWDYVLLGKRIFVSYSWKPNGYATGLEIVLGQALAGELILRS